MKFMLGLKSPLEVLGSMLSLSSNASHDDKGKDGERVVMN